MRNGHTVVDVRSRGQLEDGLLLWLTGAEQRSQMLHVNYAMRTPHIVQYRADRKHPAHILVGNDQWNCDLARPRLALLCCPWTSVPGEYRDLGLHYKLYCMC
jgi:hypothetical protein